MRLSAKFFAAMLVGLASAAFQSDSYAQSRRESRSSSVSRPANTSKPKSEARPSGSTASRPKADISPANRKPAAKPQTKPQTKPQSKPSVNKPSVGKPAGKPSVNKPSVNKPSVNRPSGNRPSHPSMDRRPPQQRPAVKPKYPRQPRVHPRDRDFMDYNKPTFHWSNNPHYYGYRVKSLPVFAKRHVYGGVTYYYYNDIWYRPYNGFYVVSRPPFGISLAANIINDIALTAVRLSYYNAQIKALEASQMANRLGLVQNYASQSDSYFYHDGVFYVQGMDGQYYVIAPPAGAIVDRLPEDFDRIVMDGEDYFKVDDTIYKMVFDSGKPYFEVVGQMY